MQILENKFLLLCRMHGLLRLGCSLPPLVGNRKGTGGRSWLRGETCRLQPTYGKSGELFYSPALRRIISFHSSGDSLSVEGLGAWRAVGCWFACSAWGALPDGFSFACSFDRLCF